MKIGIAGVGSMGTAHAAAWSTTDAQLVGFVATTQAHAQPLAQQHGAQAYPDLGSLLQDVDVLDICAPTHLHHDLARQAAAAGVHVICEKPLARTLSEAQAMLRFCREAGVKLLVGHVVRFFPEYALAHEAVAAGELGRIAVMRFKRNVFRPRKARDNWFLDFERSGGMILDLMIHDFDYARWVGGEVTSVFCKHTGDPAISPGDHGLAILTHAGGAITHVDGSWAYPPPTFRTQFEIAGSQGLLIHDSPATAPIVARWHRGDDDRSGDVPVPASPLLESPYATEIKAFYEHVAHGAPVPVTAQDGVAALQIALAAIESAKTGQVVHLQPLAEVAA